MAGQTTLEMVKLKQITISKTNPRKKFDEESIKELSDSIFQKGVLQPVVLRKLGKGYELVCGERRFRAASIVMQNNPERDAIPATIHELTNDEALELQIVENLQRKDVHPMEEAVAFKGLIDLKKYDTQEIANRVGKSGTYVAQRLKLNDLSEDFQKAFYADRLTIATAMKIVKLRKVDQDEYWNEEFEGETGKIEVSPWNLRKFTNDLNDAAFDTKDGELLPKIGACTNCEHNTASNTLLFPEDALNAKCMFSECFRNKTEVSYKKVLEEAKTDPQVILVCDEYSFSKEANALIKAGEKVYNRNQYHTEHKPDAPDIEQYDVQDYDDEADMMAAFHKDTADYQKELQEYEKKVSSGKFLKAFIVGGNYKGKFFYVNLKKDAMPKGDADATKKKENDGTITTEDIELELARLNDGEKRKKELDQEKIHALVGEKFSEHKEYLQSDDPITQIELVALILFMSDNYNVSDALHKRLKMQREWSGDGKVLVKKLFEKTPAQLTEILNNATRVMLMSKFSPTKGAPNQRPDASGRCFVFRAVAEKWIPDAVKEIDMNELNIRATREQKLEKRIKQLNEKLKELKAAEKNSKAVTVAVKPESSTKKKSVKTLTQ